MMTIDIHKFLFAGLLLALLTPVWAQSSEYLPPPTGPYQSSVVIDTVKSNSHFEAQVYRFPPADLVVPDPDFYPPPADFTFPDQGGVSAFGATPPNKPPLTGATVTEGMNVEPGLQSTPPGPAINPWAVDQPPVMQPSAPQGVWGAPYGYPAYPYGGYYNGYSANPYPAAPPAPWSMMPPAYPAR